MKTIYINKYQDWTKDLTYEVSDRKDLSYYTLRDISEKEFNKIVNLTIKEVKDLIDNII